MRHVFLGFSDAILPIRLVCFTPFLYINGKFRFQNEMLFLLPDQKK
jgi:hypothetical protein